MSYLLLANNASYGDSGQLPAFLIYREGDANYLYDDGAGNPTIGIGLNLFTPANMAVVLNQMSYDGVTLFQRAGQVGQTAEQVISAFEQLMPISLPHVNDYDSDQQNAATVAYQNALNNLLASYFGVAVSQLTISFTDFPPSAASSALQQALLGTTTISGYSVPGYSQLALNALTAAGVPSSNIPPLNSGAWEALLSLYFNNPKLFGSGMIAALKAGDVAQVWYQIRFASNPTKTTGVAQRRYLESQLFGLGQSTDTWTQAVQAFEMLTENRPRIISYEQQFGTNPNTLGDPLEAANQIAAVNEEAPNQKPAVLAPAFPVATLDQAFIPEAVLLANQLNTMLSAVTGGIGIESSSVPGGFMVLSTNIFVAPDQSEIASGFASSLDDFISPVDSPNATHLLVGPDSAGTGAGQQAELSGGTDSDILVAGAGNELLVAGAGSDTIIAGQGLGSLSGAAGTDTAEGGGGTDTFDFAVPSVGPITELILPWLNQQGVVEVSVGNDVTMLGGSKNAPVQQLGSFPDMWSGSDGTTYSYNKVTGTLTITGGPLTGDGSGNSIQIENFNISAAESSTGYIGIFLQPISAIVGGANAGVDPPIGNLVQGSSESFTYSVNAPFTTAQTITVTLSGAEPSDFDVSTPSGTEAIGSNGTFNLTLAAGATSTSFALVDATPDNGSSDIAGGATLQLSAAIPNPISGEAPLQTAPATFNYVPTPWNTDGEQQPADQLTGTPNGGGTGVTLFTGDGNNDYVSASDPKNVIELQTSGNDSIVGGSDANSIYGGQGNDIVAGGGGTDIILLGDGNSEIYAGTKTDLADAITDAASATATGEQGDFIGVLDGDNTIVGGDGNDVITAGAGDNVVVLGPGNDVFAGGWETTNVASDWSASVTGSFVLLDNTTEQFESYSNPYAQPYNGTYDETYGIDGSTTNLSGESNATIFGGTGDDYISLGNGDNYVDVGSGSSTVLGGMGDDTIIGGSGADYIKGGGGSTYIYGGSGADSIYGGDGSNTIIGGSGNATIYSSTFYDTASGGYTTNFANANLDQDYVTGGSGNDVIYGSAGQDTLIAGTGNTAIYGGSGSEDITGGSGNDLLLGGSGSDTISAGSGTDTIQVDASSSSTTVVYGGDGKDSINGGSGTDILYAGDGGVAGGATSVYASQSDASSQTTIYGGAGVQELEGGVGSTVIYGGDGGTASAPVSILGYGAGSDTFYGGMGTDLIEGGSGTNVLYAGDGGTDAAPTSVNGGSGVSTLYGGAGSSILEDSVSGEDLLVSETGDDTLTGVGSDTLVAGTGNDVLQVDGGSVSVDLSAAAGNDTIYTAGNGLENVSFGTGIELSDVSGAIGGDGAGNWYLQLGDDGPSVAIEGALTGSLQSVTYADTGAVSLATLLTDAIGGDEVVTSGSDNLFLQLGDDESVAGTYYDDTISSWGAGDTLQSGSGGGGVIYSAGNSASITSGYGYDSINSAGSQATIIGSLGDNISVSGANSLVTSASGSESITASGSDDTLIGGTGNSTFYVSNASTVIEASVGGGTDSIVSSVSYTAPTNINVLTLTGSAGLVATGNSGSDTLTSGAGTDTLIAGSSADTLVGGTGSTTFVVNNSGDLVHDSASGANNILESSVSYALPTDVNTLVLTGTASLLGTANSGSDTLVSNSGVDTLVGGSGNDTFIVNNPGDVIEPGTGTATVVFEESAGYTLPSGTNSLVLSGSASVSVTANSGNDTLVSNTGVDTLIGGTGNDTFVVNDSADVVQDTSASSTNILQSAVSYTLPEDVNTLTLVGSAAITGTGNTVANVITANAGADTLVAGAGVATLMGGPAGDTFVLDSTADIVRDSFTTASNSIDSSVSYSLVANVNTLVLTGTANLTGIANSAADTLVSNSSVDTLVGGTGASMFVISNSGDIIQDSTTSVNNLVEASVSYVLPTNVNTIVLMGTGGVEATSNSGADSLVAGAGSDTLIATSGQDTLVAGSGITTLQGGTGNDLFVLNNTADVVTVTGSYGADSIDSAVSYTLPSGVGTLILTGSSDLAAAAVSGNNSLVGNAGNDTLYAGSGNDTLIAGSGPDTLVGGSGTDTFVINSTADVVVSISGASGNAIVSAVSYTLPTGISNLTLTGDGALVGAGNASSNTIAANSGDDTLIAGSAPAVLVGGPGADLFVINSSADVIDEPDYGEKAGVDTVESSISYTLPNTVNNLILAGTAALTATGNAHSDSIGGNGGADTLYSGSGNDTLIAGTGLATLIGGDGNDTFIINATADVVDDTVSGQDNVLISSVSYTLPANIATLLLTGSSALTATANDDADSIRGNSGADTLVGGSGNDTLAAGSGLDTFIAGTASDTFIVTNSADLIQGASGGGGYAVYASSSFSLPDNVNVLTLTGVASSTGTGNSGNDTLTAGAGSDTLVAGSGAATLIGGSGNTTFVVDGTGDVVQDSSTTTSNIVQSSVSYVAPTNVNTLVLTGTANIAATANGTADTLVDNGSVDTLIGGAGNDTFSVSNASDVVEDSYTATSNAIQASVNYSLATNVNTLILTGTAALTGWANGANDTLISNDGPNTLTGNSGNDVFVINNSADVVEDDSPTANNVIQSAVNYTLPTDVNTLLLTGTTALAGTGNVAADVLTANAGNSTLTAGAGVATLVGGSGNDTFVVNSTGDVIEDTAVTASSVIESAVSYSLPTDVTTLTLIGTANLIETANSANDTLISNSGVDTLVGGSGHDLFIINNSSDVVENVNSSDTIESLVNYTLPGGANDMTLAGSADLSGTGNSTSDTLTAGAGDDTLVAGSGAATMVGGSGNETFVIDSTADAVTDTNGAASNAILASVSYTLPQNVDTLILTGSAALTATGNGDDGNVLSANSGNDAVIGTAWSNTINGGSGTDTIDAGPGDNLIYAGSGGAAYVPTYVYGNASGTSIFTQSTIYGGAGTDALYGGLGSDDLVTGSGNTAVYGGGGFETIDGSSGSNTLYGGSGSNVIYGGDGTADIYAGSGTNLIYGGSGADVPYPVNVYGDAPGTDAETQTTIYGGSGANRLLGGPGSDAIYAGGDDDSLVAGTGFDSLYGSSDGDVLLDQSSGHSLLVAGGGAETVIGYGGDTLEGGGGTALLYDAYDSAAGSTYEFDAGFGQETVGNGSASNDTLASSLNDTIDFGPGISPSSLTIGAPSEGEAYDTYSFALSISDGSGTILVNGGLNPGVINSIAFSGSGSETFTQFMNSEGIGTETIGAGTTSLLSTGNGQIINTDSYTTFWTAWAFGSDDTITDGQYSDPAEIYAYGDDDTISGYYVDAIGSNDLISLGATSYSDGYATLSGSNDSLTFSGGYADFVIEQSTDVLDVTQSTGVDSIDAFASYSLPVNVQFLTLDSAVGGLAAVSNSQGGTLIAAGANDTLTGGSGSDTLIAQSADDVLVGGSGSETYVMDSSSDSIQFGSGPASLNSVQVNFSYTTYTLTSAANSLVESGSVAIVTANSADDILTASGSYDTLVAGTGNDTLVAASTISGATLYGGPGNDTFVVNSANDVIYDTSATSNNTIESSINYTLPESANTLQLLGASNLTAVANGANDLISGNAGRDTLVAGAGDDTLAGGSGVDTFVLNAGFGNGLITNVQGGDVLQFGPGISADSVTFTPVAPTDGSPLSFVVSDGGSSVTVQGGLVPGALSSVGFSGGGTYTIPELLAPSGQVTVAGSDGNLILSSANDDSVVGGAGQDTVVAWGSDDTLSAGTGGAVIYAGGASDLAYGSEATDTLAAIGSYGTLIGGSGTETFVVGGSSAVIQVTNSPNADSILSSVDFTAPANVSFLSLTGTANLWATGNSGSDVIAGNSGDDTLVSGSGIDTLVAGAGQDTFVINNAGDVIQASGGSMNDTVEADVNYTLPAGLTILNVEGSYLSATDNGQSDEMVADGVGDTIRAGSGDDLLVGEENDEDLIGGSGNDLIGSAQGYSQLVSGTGVDTLSSTSQGDSLYINNSADIISDIAPEDTIATSVNYTIPASQAVIGGWSFPVILTGSANLEVANYATEADTIEGNSGDDTLIGGAGYNYLVSGSGVDTLIGGSRSNVFEVYNAADVVVAQAGSSDTLISGVNVTLPAYVDALDLGYGVAGTGNSDADTLIGENDTLVAGSGNDSLVSEGSSTLVAGSGDDTLSSYNDADVLVFDAGLGNAEVQESSSHVSGATVDFGSGISPESVTVSAALDESGQGSLVITGASDSITLDGGWSGTPYRFQFGGGSSLSLGQFLSEVNVDSTTITGESGNLIVDGESSAAYIDGSGNDTIYLVGSYDTLTGGSGTQILGEAGDYGSIIGGSGNDTAAAYGDYDTLVSESGSATTFDATAAGTADIVVGGSGNDTLIAQGNDATLISGTGIQTLVSENGGTIFVVNNSNDVVEDNSENGGDSVFSSVSWTLPFDIASLELIGTANLTGMGNDDPGDLIEGNSGADSLIAGSSTDTLVAGTGIDTLEGGVGADLFIVNNAADVVTVGSSHGADTLQSSVSYSLPSNVATLILAGAGGLVGTGNSLSDVIVDAEGGDTLVAGTGVATLLGGGAGDTFVVDNTHDVVQDSFDTSSNVILSSVSYTLPADVDTLSLTGTAALRGAANSDNDSLVANTGSDTLVAGSGSDTLVSGIAGTDSLVGGSGNVTFIVNNTADKVSDTSTSATNVIESSVSYSLPTDVGTLTLTGTAALKATGNAQTDLITGNGGADTLTAGSGVATMVGGSGNDTFVVNNTADVVQDTSTASGNILSSDVSYTLPTNVNALTFTGTVALKGTANSGNDTLTANSGHDTLVGGSGNDTFIISNTADVVQDTYSTSSNAISSSVAYTLPTDVNTLVLTGTAALKGTANTGNDSLVANSGADTLVAGSGVDTLVAGTTGTDSLVGGSGNDTFFVNDTADKVADTSTTASNSLESSVTYTLPTDVNTLVFTGTAALKGTANSGNDTLTSNTGADTLVGAAGNETFVVNNAADIITDTSTTASNAIDSFVSYTLPTDVNSLVLAGTAALVGTGNAHADSISGNSGADTLVSGSAVDTLIGGAGTDTFVVNNTADVVSVTASGTADSILSSVNYVLPSNVQYLTLTGAAALTATGNSLTDLIVGNTGNDTLTGGSGIAVLEGGRTAGSDVLRATGNQAALVAGGGSSTLTGGAYDDFYAAGAVSDSITTGATANVVSVNEGDGATTLQPTAGASNVLSLGAGMDTEDLYLSKSGNNLILTDGVGGDSITFSNWYAGGSDQDFTTLQVVELASASYDSGGSDPLRNQALEEFDFTSLVNAFNTAGSPSDWALSNDMVSAQLSSSATEAYGGDLAYYYGLDGNLTGMQLSAAQSTLTNASFATSSQTIDPWSGISGGGGLDLLAVEASEPTMPAAVATNALLANAVTPSAASADAGVSESAPITSSLLRRRSPGLQIRPGRLGVALPNAALNLVTPTTLSWYAVDGANPVGEIAGGALAASDAGEDGFIPAALLHGSSLIPLQRRGGSGGELPLNRAYGG